MNKINKTAELLSTAAELHQQYLTTGVYEKDLQDVVDKIKDHLNLSVSGSEPEMKEDTDEASFPELAQMLTTLMQDMTHITEGYVFLPSQKNYRLHFSNIGGEVGARVERIA